jgi:hypothetical protein
MVFGDATLRTFCSMGVPVTFKGTSTYPDGYPIKGNFDRASQNLLGEQGFGGVDLARPQVTLPYNAFATMPTNGDPITVGGTAYTVGDVTFEDDGGFIRYDLVLA